MLGREGQTSIMALSTNQQLLYADGCDYEAGAVDIVASLDVRLGGAGGSGGAGGDPARKALQVSVCTLITADKGGMGWEGQQRGRRWGGRRGVVNSSSN